MTTNHFSRAAPVAKKYAAILFDLDGKLGLEEEMRHPRYIAKFATDLFREN